MITEAEQVKLGEIWFVSQGFQTYQEVPIFENSLDLLLVEGVNYHGIEFKLKNWKKVIQQAKKHRRVLEYVSIFLLKPKLDSTTEKIINECMASGLGLYFLQSNGSIIQSLIPKKNNIWQVEKDRVTIYIQSKK